MTCYLIFLGQLDLYGESSSCGSFERFSAQNYRLSLFPALGRGYAKHAYGGVGKNEFICNCPMVFSPWEPWSWLAVSQQLSVNKLND